MRDGIIVLLIEDYLNGGNRTKGGVFMGKKPTSSAESLVYQARIRAGYSSAEKAIAAGLALDPSTLRKYEAGLMRIPIDVLEMLQRFYGEELLVERYCLKNYCKIELRERSAPEATLQILSLLGKKVNINTLTDILADGEISEDEIDDLEMVSDWLELLDHSITELRIALNKKLKGR